MNSRDLDDEDDDDPNKRGDIEEDPHDEIMSRRLERKKREKEKTGHILIMQSQSLARTFDYEKRSNASDILILRFTLLNARQKSVFFDFAV